MTQEELRQTVLDHQFSETRYTTFINQTLNEAQRKIARRANLRIWFDTEIYTTAAADDTYALPSDYARLFTVENTTDNQPLTHVDITRFDTLPTGSSGTPTQYTIDRPNLILYPVPDGVYTLQMRYYRSPVDITASVDPELPEDWQQLLVSYTLARCFRRENDLEAAQFHMDEFTRDLAEMKADFQEDDEDASQAVQVGGMWDDSSESKHWVVRP